MSEKPNFLDYVNVYEFECELPGSKQKVKFKPVTTGQIKKLLTYENETNYVIQEQALDDLISSSVLSEGFSSDELYIYDRMYLLMELRKKTKGEILEFKIDCPKCKSQSINRVNLDELEMKQLEDVNDQLVDFGDVKVYLRHMKRKHQKRDITPNLFPKKLTSTQQGYIFQVLFHACAINKIETPKGIDENIDMKNRIFFIENIPMQQMEMIKNTVESMEFGWKLENKIQCPHCGHEESEEIPIQQNFFG
jgi:transcription elongation factor Elf1/ribosomal protein L28